MPRSASELTFYFNVIRTAHASSGIGLNLLLRYNHNHLCLVLQMHITYKLHIVQTLSPVRHTHYTYHPDRSYQQHINIQITSVYCPHVGPNNPLLNIIHQFIKRGVRLWS